MTELGIRRLSDADADAVATLLSADPPKYRAHFDPFTVDAAAIALALSRASRDRYWGLTADGELVGLMLLRGLDAGYAVPALGVYVAEQWSRRGLARLTLAFAEAWCRLNQLEELMLTVHPENAPARGLYERSGFRFDGEHSERGHRIYRKSLSDRGDA